MYEWSSEFFGQYSPVLYAWEKARRGKFYALVGGYACRYWLDLYHPSGKRHFHKDIDSRGGEEEADIASATDSLVLKSDRFLHGTTRYELQSAIRLRNPEIIEIFPLLPVLDEKDGQATPELQGIVYRVPNNFDPNLIISTLDPLSLFITKQNAYASPARQSDPKTYHDGEHLEMLAEIIPLFLKDVLKDRFEQSCTPKRDIRIAAKRLYEFLSNPQIELPPKIDKEALLQELGPISGSTTETFYGPTL